MVNLSEISRLMGNILSRLVVMASLLIR